MARLGSVFGAFDVAHSATRKALESFGAVLVQNEGLDNNKVLWSTVSGEGESAARELPIYKMWMILFRAHWWLQLFPSSRRWKSGESLIEQSHNRGSHNHPGGHSWRRNELPTLPLTQLTTVSEYAAAGGRTVMGSRMQPMTATPRFVHAFTDMPPSVA